MSLERIAKRIKDKNIPKKAPVKQPVNSTGESLLKALGKFLEGRSTKRFRKISGFHPSYSALKQSNCKRWWYLLFDGVESDPKVSGRLQRIFDTGNDMHERFTEYFEAMGILEKAEVPVKMIDPIPITGSADGIINWGGRKLIELKSINPDGFQFRKFYKKPKDTHYLQAQIYMHCLHLDEGYIIYEDKATQKVLIFPIEKDEEVIEKYLRKMQRMYKVVNSGQLPDRQYKRDSPQCQACDLEKTCWEKLPPDNE